MKLVKYATFLAAVAAMNVLLSQSAHAIALSGLTRGGGSAIEKVTQPTRAPIAYMMLCLTLPNECRSHNQAEIVYSADLMTKISHVNDNINSSMIAQLDKGDTWQVGGKTGDCEDFALTKRRDLINAGVAAGALRMAVVKTEKGDGHAVLIVKTDLGDLVLDNRRNNIVLSQNSGYTFLKMATENPLKWNKLDHEGYIYTQNLYFYTQKFANHPINLGVRLDT